MYVFTKVCVCARVLVCDCVFVFDCLCASVKLTVSFQ